MSPEEGGDQDHKVSRTLTSYENETKGLESGESFVWTGTDLCLQRADPGLFSRIPRMPNIKKVQTIRALKQRNELHYEVVSTLCWERSKSGAICWGCYGRKFWTVRGWAE